MIINTGVTGVLLGVSVSAKIVELPATARQVPESCIGLCNSVHK